MAEKNVLSVTLREMAREHGLCDEWYEEWQDDTDIDALLDKYIRGYDFCIKHGYPSLDFCRNNFDVDDLHRHNIYLDEAVGIDAKDSGYFIFIGNCSGVLHVDGLRVATVYVRHNSRITVKSTGGAIVFVRCYENADATIVKDAISKGFKYNR